ncbi:MAG: glycosyltransferase family 2 protein [Flavobacteriales bacterium]|nr:glycosyltransferase family 2 protein [Flavobacteriales bacterium]
MKVTALLPVYNKAPWLQECLDSILGQRFGDFELLAVDDASTDGSAEILARCSDPRLRVLRMPKNSGPGLAAQHGMGAAQGEYILRVDADDVLMPERFARQVAFLDAHPEVGLCGSALELLHAPGERRSNPADHAAAIANLPFGVALFQPTMAMRRSVLQAHDIRYLPHWPRFGEDWLFQASAIRHTRIANLPEALVRYREGPQNTAHGRDRSADLERLCKAVFPLLGFPVPDPAQCALNAMAVNHFRRAPDRAQLLAFKAWLAHLVHVNNAQGLLDHAAFSVRTQAAWDALLYQMPRFGSAAVWAYLRSGARLDAPRAYYLFRSLLGGGTRSGASA